MLKSVLERLKEIQEMSKSVEYTDNQAILDVFINYVPSFNDIIGETLEKGRLIQMDGIKYLVMQQVVAQEHQSPDSTGMLAIYKPYTDSSTKEWIYGEYVEIGWKRIYNDITYKAIQDPNANIYSPNLIPAIWEVTKTEEEA